MCSVSTFNRIGPSLSAQLINVRTYTAISHKIQEPGVVADLGKTRVGGLPGSHEKTASDPWP